MPKPRITDQQLRFEIEQGLSASQIAAKYQLRRQSVDERVRKLTLQTAAVATVAPLESRQYVRNELDTLQHLVVSLQRINKMYDAIDAWARDANDPDKYDLGPRDNEVMVTILEPAGDVDDEGAERMRRVKRPLRELLRRIEDKGTFTDGAEVRVADMRVLLLQTAQELRQSVTAGVELAARIADAQAMAALREAILSAIAKVRPDVAQEIAESVRSVLILHGSLGGSTAVSAGRGADR